MYALRIEAPYQNYTNLFQGLALSGYQEVTIWVEGTVVTSLDGVTPGPRLYSATGPVSFSTNQYTLFITRTASNVSYINALITPVVDTPIKLCISPCEGN